MAGSVRHGNAFVSASFTPASLSLPRSLSQTHTHTHAFLFLSLSFPFSPYHTYTVSLSLPHFEILLFTYVSLLFGSFHLIIDENV